MPLRDCDCSNVLTIKVADADPTIVGARAVQITCDGLAFDQSPHEGPGIATITVGGFRAIDAVETHSCASHHNCVNVPNFGHTTFNLASLSIGRSYGAKQKAHTETRQGDAFQTPKSASAPRTSKNAITNHIAKRTNSIMEARHS
ncbi:hypothetical protein RAZWK3B_14514 [Roseobacter sp. AzwK-3b]|nr:hypothetical protein RAZWK3B_14514 [Roseobacter sp. AzwK-3b]